MKKSDRLEDILFVATKKSHYANLALAEALGAKIFHIPIEMTKFSSKISKLKALAANSYALPSPHDVYFTESTFFYPAIKRKLKLLPKGSRIVNLYGTPLLYLLDQKAQLGPADRSLTEFLMGEIDANVLLGELGIEMAKKNSIIRDLPSMKADLWLSDEIRRKIDSTDMRYSPGSKKIFTIARFDWYYKGLDIVLKGFEKAWAEDNDLSLHVLGGGTVPTDVLGRIDPKCKERIDFSGYLSDDDYWNLMAGCSLYVHMGRGDPYPLSVLEAMYCGKPAIVSSYTGTKDAAIGLGRDFVIELDPDILAKRILSFMDMKESQKTALSEKARDIGSKYSRENLSPRFRKDFIGLLEKI